MTMHLGRKATFFTAALLAAGGAIANETPGEGVTVRPIEGTLLEERGLENLGEAASKKIDPKDKKVMPSDA